MASAFPEVRASEHGSWSRWSCATWKGQRTQRWPVVLATSGLEHGIEPLASVSSPVHCGEYQMDLRGVVDGYGLRKHLAH